MTMTYNAGPMTRRMSEDLIQELNARLFFQAGMKKPKTALRPWQYVEMEYRDMGLTPPSYVPSLETIEDAEIWMCLDERVNRGLRMRETGIAV